MFLTNNVTHFLTGELSNPDNFLNLAIYFRTTFERCNKYQSLIGVPDLITGVILPILQLYIIEIFK